MPVPHQIIIWSNAWLLLIVRLETNFSKFSDQNATIFVQEYAIENVVCIMMAMF